MDNATSLIAASVSAVVIIGLMATYVQIMNHLIDKQYWLPQKMREKGEKEEQINRVLGNIRFYLKLLTWQGLLFFFSVFLLLAITVALVLKTFENHPAILYTSLGVIVILFISQILHAIVFWKSYKKYVCSDDK